MGLLHVLRDSWRKNSPELAALWNGALPEFVFARNPRGPLGGIPVFSYHLVEAASFEADLLFLKANDYCSLNSSEFLGYLEGTGTVPERSVLLTFDDGPVNFYRIAFPLLTRYDARAIAFIAPGLHADEAESHDDERPMSWSELQEIRRSGLVEFQSHTLESRFVPEWPLPVPLMGCDPRLEDLRRRTVALPFAEDLAASRQMLERRLPGSTINQLAFPRYVGTEEAVAAAKSQGFRACYWGLMPGRALNRRGDSSFHVSRVNDEFLRRLPGEGRVSISAMVSERWRRVRAARQRRHRFEQVR